MSSIICSTLPLCGSRSNETERIQDPQQSLNASSASAQKRKRPSAAEDGSSNKSKRGSGKGNHEDEIAPFVLKTKEMITKCDKEYPDIAAWSVDGGMFLIKNQEVFAEKIIPQFFDHSKFLSYVRQLNFYGFRKLQTTAIYKKDQECDDTTKYVAFKNEFFHRDRPELLPKIKRAHKDKGGQDNKNMQKKINALEEKVASLEQTIQLLQQGFKDQFEALKKDMLSQCTTTTSSTAEQHAVQNASTYQNLKQDKHPNNIKTQPPVSDDLDFRNEYNEFNPEKVQKIIDEDSKSAHQPPVAEKNPHKVQSAMIYPTTKTFSMASYNDDFDGNASSQRSAVRRTSSNNDDQLMNSAIGGINSVRAERLRELSPNEENDSNSIISFTKEEWELETFELEKFDWDLPLESDEKESAEAA